MCRCRVCESSFFLPAGPSHLLLAAYVHISFHVFLRIASHPDEEPSVICEPNIIIVINKIEMFSVWFL